MTLAVLRRWAWPIVALLVFLVAWSASSHRVALYDGVGFPDEPYRFVDPPAGAQATKPPTSGVARSGVRAGTTSDALYVNSAEQGPQVSVFVPPHVVAAPGATSVTMRATPEAPDRPPGGGRIDGNVYRVGVTTTPGDRPVSLRHDVTATAGSAGIVLRATTGKQPGPSFVYRTGAGRPWRVLPTARVGNDIYRAGLAGLGDYALAWGVRPAGDVARHGGGLGLVTLLLALLAVALVALIVGIRVARRRPS